MIALTGYTAFFDRSPDHGLDPEGGTVVARFLSTVQQWALWEHDWNSVLDDFPVPYFHMKEFTPFCRGRPWPVLGRIHREGLKSVQGEIRRFRLAVS